MLWVSARRESVHVRNPVCQHRCERMDGQPRHEGLSAQSGCRRLKQKVRLPVYDHDARLLHCRLDFFVTSHSWRRSVVAIHEINRSEAATRFYCCTWLAAATNSAAACLAVKALPKSVRTGGSMLESLRGSPSNVANTLSCRIAQKSANIGSA